MMREYTAKRRFWTLSLAYFAMIASVFSLMFWLFPKSFGLIFIGSQLIVQPFWYACCHIKNGSKAGAKNQTFPYFHRLKSRLDWLRFWAVCNGVIGLAGLGLHFLIGHPTWAEVAFMQFVASSLYCLTGGLLEYDRQQMAAVVPSASVSVTPRASTPVAQNVTVPAPLSISTGLSSGTTEEAENYVVVGKP